MVLCYDVDLKHSNKQTNQKMKIKSLKMLFINKQISEDVHI